MKDTMKPAVEAFKKGYTQKILAAIDWAMVVDPMYRPQSVDELLEAMGDGGKLGPAYKGKGGSMLGRIAGNLFGSKGGKS